MIKKIIKIFALAFSFLSFGIANADTNVSGTISSNTTWTLANSPYIVTGNITVNVNYTLTIEPGVVVKFNNGTALNVNGRLIADGTPENKIYFTSINDWTVGGSNGGTGSPARGNWLYININGAGSNGSIIDNAEIRYAGQDYGTASNTDCSYPYTSTKYKNRALILDSTQTTLSNVRITNTQSTPNCYDGWNTVLALIGGNNTITGVTINDYKTRGIYIEGGTQNINNSVINGYRASTFDRADYGITIKTGTVSLVATITNSTIEENQTGVLILGGDPVMTGNIIRNNNYGVDSFDLEIRIGAKDISSNNTITGSSIANVGIRNLNIRGTTGTLDASVYELSLIGSGDLNANKTLTILPGSVIKMFPSVSVNINGRLIADGTPENKIYFTSKNDNTIGSNESSGTGSPARGNWLYININGAGSNGSIIDNAEIRYAGQDYGTTSNADCSYPYTSTKYKNRALILDSTQTTLSNVRITNTQSTPNCYDGWNTVLALIGGNNTITGVTINDYKTRGIYIEGGTQNINNSVINGYRASTFDRADYGITIKTGTVSLVATITNSTIEENQTGVRILGGDPVMTGNIIRNNNYGVDSFDLEIRIGAKDISSNNTITGSSIASTVARSTDIRYPTGTLDTSQQSITMIDNGILPINKTLTIAPGSVIKMASGISFNVKGRLIAEGEPSNKIIFTSVNDNTAGEALGNGNPTKGSWLYIYINGAGTNGSIIDNAIIRYAGQNYGTTSNADCSYPYTSTKYYNRALVLNNTQTIVKDSIFENIYGTINCYEGWNTVIHVNGGSTVVEGNLFRENTPKSSIYINGGTQNVQNNTIDGLLHDQYGVINGRTQYGIIDYTGGNNLLNNIVLSHGVYGIYDRLMTSNMLNNIFFNNVANSNVNPLNNSNQITDPLFVNGTYELNPGSPAVGAGTNGEDVGAFSLGESASGYLTLYSNVQVNGVNKNLSYTWDFIEKPALAGDITINGKVGTVTSNSNVRCSYEIRYTGNYKLKFTLIDGGQVVGSQIKTFTVTK
ncbi:MAG: hypothetical protein PHI37_05760 [Candidatus Gracilibacteria bacterium]|nr:hypothetical protein [Candidatus Gracilibacteria bacterium]